MFLERTTTQSSVHPAYAGNTSRPRRSASCSAVHPAYAGNTTCRSCPRSSRTVHPRVCGEHPSIRPCTTSALGSSPRMRGTRAAPAAGSARRRFIPAYAGNTRMKIVSTERYRGSSPRMRGTHAPGSQGLPGYRFIPAYAGNTNAAVERDPDDPVYPRVCGEHKYTSISVMGTSGSSPRMRGTRRA